MARQIKPKPQGQAIYEMQAGLCAALAHPVRLQILDLIGQGEMTASELLSVLHIPKPNLTQHLSVLKDAGILQGRKEGLFLYLSLGLPKIKEACAIVKSVLTERIELEQRQHAELRKQLRRKS